MCFRLVVTLRVMSAGRFAPLIEHLEHGPARMTDCVAHADLAGAIARDVAGGARLAYLIALPPGCAVVKFRVQETSVPGEGASDPGRRREDVGTERGREG